MYHASAPAWTKTPLFVELSVLKQQVVVLTDDNVRLSGVAQRMTATCSALSKEVHRLKVAFAALTDLLDAEVASLRTDGTKLWQEVASLKEVGPPIWEELKSNAAAIERQRVAAEGTAGRWEEWMRHVVGEVEEIRDLVAAHKTQWQGEPQKRAKLARELRELIAGAAHASEGQQFDVVAVQLEQQKAHELASRALTAHEELKRSTADELTELRARFERHRADAAYSLKTAEEALVRSIDGKVSQSVGGLPRIERQAREADEVAASARDGLESVLGRFPQIEEEYEAAALRCAHLEKQMHAAQLEAKEHADALRMHKEATAPRLASLEHQLEDAFAEISALKAAQAQLSFTRMLSTGGERTAAAAAPSAAPTPVTRR